MAKNDHFPLALRKRTDSEENVNMLYVNTMFQEVLNLKLMAMNFLDVKNQALIIPTWVR